MYWRRAWKLLDRTPWEGGGRKGGRRRGVVKASPEKLRPTAREERHAWQLVEAELRTKLVNFDEFSGHRFEDITTGETPSVPVEEDDPVEEEMVFEPSSGSQEIHPDRWSECHWKTTIGVGDPSQLDKQDSQQLNVDGKRPRVENETASGDTPSDRCASPSATSSAGRNHISSRHSSLTRRLPFQCVTSILLGLWTSIVSEFVPVMPMGRRSWILKILVGRRRKAKILLAEGQWKEMESLVEDTKAWVPVALEKSRLLRSSVPDRTLQPRLVLALRMKDDSAQEVESRCPLQGLKGPDVLKRTPLFPATVREKLPTTRAPRTHDVPGTVRIHRLASNCGLTPPAHSVFSAIRLGGCRCGRACEQLLDVAQERFEVLGCERERKSLCVQPDLHANPFDLGARL